MIDPAIRQYAACKFRVEDTRTYTYHFDGPALEKGDVVRVTDRDGDGWKKVHVVFVSNVQPTFQTKPILGLHVEEDDSAAAVAL